MTHLSLNLEPLEPRKLFSVTGDVALLPGNEIDGPSPHMSPAAFDAFNKIGVNSANRAFDFFLKAQDPTAPGNSANAFSKVGEAALAQSLRFFAKVEGQEVIG